MKMLNNGLEVDVFATSRTPIPSPRSTKMGEGDRRCAARPPERPVQVHPDHHAEDGAAAVAEHADGVDACEQKGYKNSSLPSTVQLPMCGECQNTMAPRRKRKRRTTRRRPPAKRPRRVTYSQVGGVGVGLHIGILKAGYGITKAIGDHQTKRAIEIGEKRRREVASGKRKRYAGESFNCSIM